MLRGGLRCQDVTRGIPEWQVMMSRRRLIVQRIASLASRLRFGVRRRSSSVFVAGAARNGSKAVEVRRNACAVQWARWSQYSGGRSRRSFVQIFLG